VLKLNIKHIFNDINFSNLLRRVDNHSPYRWALHGYAGIGTLGIKLIDKMKALLVAINYR
jgi:hypothetical protein